MNQQIDFVNKNIKLIKMCSHDQQEDIDQLFYDILSISNRFDLYQSGRTTIIPSKNSLVLILKGNQFSVIFSYLSFKDLLCFRLVSQLGKTIVKQILVQQIEQYDNYQSIIEQDKIKETQLIFDNQSDMTYIDEYEVQKQAALTYLNNVDKMHLVELRSYRNPPDIVKKTFDLVEDLLQARQIGEKLGPKDEKWKKCINSKTLINDLRQLLDSNHTQKDDEILAEFDAALEQNGQYVSLILSQTIHYIIMFSQLQQTKFYKLRSETDRIKHEAKKQENKIISFKKLLKY